MSSHEFDGMMVSYGVHITPVSPPSAPMFPAMTQIIGAARTDEDIITELRERGAKAYEDGDDELAHVLREAFMLLKKRLANQRRSR